MFPGSRRCPVHTGRPLPLFAPHEESSLLPSRFFLIHSPFLEKVEETHRSPARCPGIILARRQRPQRLVRVDPDHQGRGLGKLIMENILDRLPECNVILYASPGKEGFYQKHGFRRMKTGMARFIKSDAMQERDFTE